MSADPVNVLLMVRELSQGGCERDLTKLAKSLDRSKFIPHVGCFSSEGLRAPELRALGIPIVEFPVRSFASPSTIRVAGQMRRYLRDHQVKVVHCFDGPTVLFGVPVAYFCRIPAIVSAQLGERELYTKAHHKLVRTTDHLADVVVANSRAIQQYLIDREHVPANRTYLCYNGVETQFFRPGPPKPSAPLVIGTVCALRPEKRVDLLIKAFAQVRHLLPGMKLLIVGSGSVLPQLEALRAELNLGESCVFEPAKSDVVPWMRALDIFVISSETESFPNGLLEAMACGCASVGSRVGGIPELITDQVSGLLFESKNVESLAAALTKLIQDQTLRERLAKQAVNDAHGKFSLETFARCNESLYERLLAVTVSPPAEEAGSGAR
jgi:glycosyltransferase involved in cell wall biosynthesis